MESTIEWVKPLVNHNSKVQHNLPMLFVDEESGRVRHGHFARVIEKGRVRYYPSPGNSRVGILMAELPENPLK